MYFLFIFINITLILALTSINLTIPGLSSDDWHRIDQEKERLLTNVTEYAHIGPNEFGSSIGGSTITIDGEAPANDFDDGGDDGAIFNFHNIIDVNVELSDDENDIFQPPDPGHEDDEDFLLWISKLLRNVEQ